MIFELSSSVIFFLLATPVIVSLSLLIILTIVNFTEIKKHFLKISRNCWIVVIFILIIGICLRVLPPLCSAQDTLIWEYALIGKNIVEGVPTRGHSTQPTGYPLLLSIVYLFSGSGYAQVILFNIILSSLTVLIVFFITYLITKDETSSIFSMVFLAFFPMAIFHAQFGATEITSVFFFSLSVMFLLISLESRKIKMFILAFVSLTLSCYMRLENVFIITALFVVCYAIFMANKKDLKKLILPVIVFGLLITPLSFLISKGDRTFGPSPHVFPPGADRDLYLKTSFKGSFSVTYLPENIAFVLDKFLKNKKYPVILYPFIILSVFSIKKFHKVLVPALWLALSVGFFGRFWALKFVNPELYLTNIHPALSVLYGIGIISIFHSINKRYLPYKSICKFCSSVSSLIRRSNRPVTLWLASAYRSIRRTKLVADIHVWAKPIPTSQGWWNFLFKIIFLVLLLAITIIPSVQILLNWNYESQCYPKELYFAANELEGCIITEESENGTVDVKKVVTFILPNKNIYTTTEVCKEGYFIKIRERFFKEIFGDVSNKNVFENCTLYNITKGLNSIDIYGFTCT